MRVDGGIGTGGVSAADNTRRRRAARARGAGLRRHLVGGDDPRSVLPAAPRRADDRARRARHRHRGGLRPQPDDPGPDRLGPAGRVEGRFILGLGSQIKPHITKRFSMEWSSPGGPDAGDDPRHPRHLGLLERRHQARLPWRLLHAHADDAVLQPGTEPARQRQDLSGRRGRADDGGRRRGVRRLPLPQLHDRALPA